MDRGLILQMLSKLPPERLGQLVAEAQGTREGGGQPLLTNEQPGLSGTVQQQRDIPQAYQSVRGRYF